MPCTCIYLYLLVCLFVCLLVCWSTYVCGCLWHRFNYAWIYIYFRCVVIDIFILCVAAVGCLWITLLSGPIIGSIPHPSLAIQTIESGAEWTTPDSSCNLKPHQMQQHFLTMCPKSIGNQQLDSTRSDRSEMCFIPATLAPNHALYVVAASLNAYEARSSADHAVWPVAGQSPGPKISMGDLLTKQGLEQKSHWRIKWTACLSAFSIPCTCVDVCVHNASLMHVISATMCAYRYLVICVKHLCVCVSLFNK